MVVAYNSGRDSPVCFNGLKVNLTSDTNEGWRWFIRSQNKSSSWVIADSTSLGSTVVPNIGLSRKMFRFTSGRDVLEVLEIDLNDGC